MFCVLDFVCFVVPCMVENSYCWDASCLESLTPADLFVELFFKNFKLERYGEDWFYYVESFFLSGDVLVLLPMLFVNLEFCVISGR